MKKIILSLPDKKQLEYDMPVKGFEVAKNIGEGLFRSAIAVKVNDQVKDISYLIEESSKIEIITPSSLEGLKILRHTAAHVMAEAISQLWQETKFAIGPTIENGFYYDVDSTHVFTPEDLQTIENKMKEIITNGSEIIRFEMSIKEALQYFKKKGDIYKVELIEDLMKEKDPPEKVSIYKQGSFEDLCRGPHLPSTRFIKAFKITSLAGAYWRGKETRQMLQRIYGTAFQSKKELTDYLALVEEAKKRDHRVLGKTLDLFSFHKESPGAVFFHKGGVEIYNILTQYIRNVLDEQNYQEIMTPQILDIDLWHKSGHFDNYKEAMYFITIDEKTSAVKPMNCPGHLLVYKTQKRSYRDLPLKLAELGTVHRHEKSGVTHGLMRVRKFTQDDAHIFCREDQIEKEVLLLIKTICQMYADFGLDKVDIRLSTRPLRSIGTEEIWKKAERALRNALKDTTYIIDEGDGAFYGPKIDFDVYDSLGRPWQLGTIQLDFSMPERFDLNYTGEDGKDHRPVMIHRAVYGSLERFIGVLIEHFGGDFPVWLAPLQAKILSVSEKHVDYANKVYQNLKSHRLRVELDTRNEKLGYKIRESELLKCPYMIIVGDNEAQNTTVSVRSRVDKTQRTMSLVEFSNQLVAESKLKGGC